MVKVQRPDAWLLPAGPPQELARMGCMPLPVVRAHEDAGMFRDIPQAKLVLECQAIRTQHH